MLFFIQLVLRLLKLCFSNQMLYDGLYSKMTITTSPTDFLLRLFFYASYDIV